MNEINNRPKLRHAIDHFEQLLNEVQRMDDCERFWLWTNDVRVAFEGLSTEFGHWRRQVFERLFLDFAETDIATGKSFQQYQENDRQIAGLFDIVRSQLVVQGVQSGEEVSPRIQNQASEHDDVMELFDRGSTLLALVNDHVTAIEKMLATATASKLRTPLQFRS